MLQHNKFYDEKVRFEFTSGASLVAYGSSARWLASQRDTDSTWSTGVTPWAAEAEEETADVSISHRTPTRFAMPTPSRSCTTDGKGSRDMMIGESPTVWRWPRDGQRECGEKVRGGMVGPSRSA